MRPARTIRRPEPDVDGEALALRRAGRSFAAIARVLALRSPQAAHDAFLRGVGRAAPSQRMSLLAEELKRLRELEARVRGNADLAPFDRDRQLAVVDTLRHRLSGAER